MMRFSANKFYCFSPLVMIVTFLIEISLALYSLWRYGLNPITRIAVIMLTCLAIFQFAEFNVCEEAWALSGITWARLGYVAITLLPPLGLHLVARLAGEKRRWPYYSAYLLAAIFSSYFLFATNGLTSSACLGNYVIFEQGPGSGLFYGLYYYGLLIATIFYAMWLQERTKPHIRRALRSLVVGYGLFIIPTTFLNILDPSTIFGIPSIMCGFAVVLALVIAFSVLPHAHSKGV